MIGPVPASYDFTPFRTIGDIGGGPRRMSVSTSLHDWSDDQCIAIRRIAKTAPDGARLLLVEAVKS